VEAASAGVRIVRDRVREVLQAARVALVASGTATVETALSSVPMVVVYRLSPLTYALGKPFVRVKNYAMVNLIAGRTVVPELIQSDFTPARVADEALEILDDGPARSDMLASLADVRRKLGAPGATKRAADEVLTFLTSG
jgi:lipid-A-disaccharide synthase